MLLRVLADHVPPFASRISGPKNTPYWADVQADQSLCWSLRSYCRFCHVLVQILCGYHDSQLSLSRIQSSLKYLKISVPRHIRFAKLRKNKSNNHISCNLTLEVRYIENIVEERRNCSLGAISPLFHNILLPVVRFSCLNRDQIFTSRQAVIRDKRGRDKESQLFIWNYAYLKL